MTVGCDVVLITRNRSERVLETLERLVDLPERPRIIVVDNASHDGTPQGVRRRFPGVRVIRLARNLGAAARNVGVRASAAPVVAFSDDDSWWATGALGRACDAFRTHPRLGAVAARILVGPGERLDPTSAGMASSPLGWPPGLPGPAVMGFVACGAVVRRRAYLEAGGFHPRYGMGAEEALLAIDMAARRWSLAYMPEVVAHHHPHPGHRPGRLRGQVRNALWTAWLRRPAGAAARRTVELLSRQALEPDAWRAAFEALRGVPWVLRERRSVPPEVERALRALD